VALGLWTDGRCVAGTIERGSTDRHRVFRTGDLVRQRADGLLERIGRKDRQVKIRGTRVDLDGVEALLRRDRRVGDAAVIARRGAGADGARGAMLVAYVTADGSAHAGLLDDLKQHMRSAPPAMRPTHSYLVATIPRLPSSKVDLRALMALDATNAEREPHTIGILATDPDPITDPDPMAQAVAQAWHRVLQTPVVAGEDDFFDAGGDSLSAITFVNELERTLGCELPLTLISDAPTFDGLCAAIRSHRTGYVPLVALKPGDDSPPVFIIHGLGGTVAALMPAARRMHYAGAVIGIRARGLRRGESPHASVEAMADEYLNAVKTRQPHGPYYLCGYFGGLVAFEMARRLRESGEEVALAGLFDTTISPLRRPIRAWLSVAARRVGQLTDGGVIETLRNIQAAWPLGMIKVSVAALLASIRYRPGFYAGELTLFTPQEREPRLPSLAAVWSPHARAVSVVETAGAHATMFSARNAEATAQSLTRCLGVRPAA
jgi:thioesterase domain-containing protein/acyl carrier protein